MDARQSPFIGREGVLRALQGSYAEAIAARAPRGVFIAGGTGSGRSRVLEEFGRWVEEQPCSTLILRGRGTPEHREQPYALFRELVAAYFAHRGSSLYALDRAGLVQALGELLGADSEADSHILGQILGVDFSDSPYPRAILEDTRQRQQVLRAAARIFEAIHSSVPWLASPSPASRNPDERRLLVLLLDDLHWVDDGSLALLDFRERIVESFPALIVAATDTDFPASPIWNAFPHLDPIQHLTLQPLSSGESSDLLSQLLSPISPIPPVLVNYATEHANGNPLAITALVDLLTAKHITVLSEHEEQAHVELSRLHEYKAPGSLPRLFQMLMGTLPDPVQQTLQRASIFGSIFWRDALLSLYRQPASGADEMDTSLSYLLARGLIEAREETSIPPAREYGFTHSLLRESAYHSIQTATLQTFHGQAATWLAQQASEQPAIWAGQVASHYERAGQVESAASWYERAGQAARQRFAPLVATEYFGRALALLPATGQTLARRVELHASQGEALLAETQVAEATVAFEMMREAATQSNDVLAQARAWLGLADAQTRLGDYNAALESARFAAGAARRAGARGESSLANALFRQGWSFMKLGIMDAALSLGEQALDLSVTLQLRPMMAKSLRLLGAVLTTQGRNFELATSYFDKALSLYRELGDRLGEGFLLNNLGVLAFKHGDYESAVTRYEEALAIARELGSRDLEGLVRDNTGEAQVGLGNYMAAERMLREVIDGAEREDRSEFSSIAYSYLAKALLGQDRIREALPLAEKALSLATITENQTHIAAAWRALGMVLARTTSDSRRPDRRRNTPPHKPHACFELSARLFAELRADAERARTLREWAWYELSRGDSELGNRLWQEASDLFAQHGMWQERARMSRPENDPTTPSQGAGDARVPPEVKPND